MNKIIIVLFFCFLFSCQEKGQSKEILFVCTHGAARSPIAMAYFNKVVKKKNLNYHAIFRGTNPDSTLTSETIKGLNKDGFNVSNWETEIVSKMDIKKASRIITFDCKLPLYVDQSKIEQWNGTPSISNDFDLARNIIKEKINKFIETLPKD